MPFAIVDNVVARNKLVVIEDDGSCSWFGLGKPFVLDSSTSRRRYNKTVTCNLADPDSMF